MNMTPKPKTAQEISKLIFSLKDGEGIWFSYSPSSGEGEWVEKRVEGDEYVYLMGQGKYKEYLETDEDIERYAKEILENNLLRYYLILPIQGYRRPRYHDYDTDDQQVGDYEMNGPDRPSWKDVYQETITKSKLKEIIKSIIKEIIR